MIKTVEQLDKEDYESTLLREAFSDPRFKAWHDELGVFNSHEETIEMAENWIDGDLLDRIKLATLGRCP